MASGPLVYAWYKINEELSNADTKEEKKMETARKVLKEPKVGSKSKLMEGAIKDSSPSGTYKK